MFSQFRHAVETFAPLPRNSSEEAGHNDGGSTSPHLRSQSGDFTSPTHLAENALSSLSNLRKSFSPTLPGSPSSPSQKSPATPRPSTPRPYKSTLEERLRAATTFTIGEASNSTTPQPSARASPAPSILQKDQPLSPSSTPLPDSPISSLSSNPSTSDPLCNPPLQSDSFPNDADESVTSGEIDKSQAAQMHSEPGAHDDLDVHHTPEGDDFPAKEDTEDHVDAEGPVDDETAEPSVESDDASTNPIALTQETPHTPTADELEQRSESVSPGPSARFADVSTSFKRLQAEKTAADTVLREFTPLESIRDSDALRDFLHNVALKTELSQEEIKRLNTKLQTQESRIEELRDTHRLESHSQSNQIDSLKKQLEESELLMKALQASNDELSALKAENEHLNGEVAKGKEMVKDEEDKRSKAISLLKTVRQKLAKAEKDRDEAAKELSVSKEKERGERAREEAEKLKHQTEIDTLNAERDKALNGLKAQFDRELAVTKERHEKDLAAVRAELELGAVTAKAAFDKELATKNARITQLENSLNAVVRDKNSFFERVQISQAELESSQVHLESLQSQNAELQHQLREQGDRIAILTEELSEARREHDLPSSNFSKDSTLTSSEDTARLLTSVEVKYEAKLTELKRVLNNMEKERNESDAEWSRKLREKNKELERLGSLLGTATQSKAQDDGVVENLKLEITTLQQQITAGRTEVSELRTQIAQLKENETTFSTREAEADTKIKVLEQKLEELKSRESQIRATNKTLRDELRKVQSSAALLDRQRNPGIGYWNSRTEAKSSESVNSSSTSLPPTSRTSSDNARNSHNSPAKKEEEEVNLEYLRNVILQFLEHKEMRPNLVRVLSIILHFTPQETRRLIAKV
ncbi:hypothetical protein F5878DRAFT_21405 [Lentinula raphanica]|uniref:GRIP domain-containing protein n=1 Tax=Lentinula raphanica TaxID=153919 RepID=A0AA38UL87_9AGAR|nr:hypothetical protein F5878DRAFT_21405 [Lentinula raphanica]